MKWLETEAWTTANFWRLRIRYPVEPKGGYQPVSVAKSINERTILSAPCASMPVDTGTSTEFAK